MKNEIRKNFITAAFLFTTFVLWTTAICLIDVKPIGPNGSSVGFAAFNAWFHNLTGVHFSLYHITDWLGLVPVAFCFGFAILGLAQWICRKKLRLVDRSLFVLGGYYMVVIISYFFFESVVINYRPVLIDGFLESSYPSSTTLLVLCVMPTTMEQFKEHIQKPKVLHVVNGLISLFAVFMVVGRLVSGVHWFSDIVGGMLLSFALVMLYRTCAALFQE